MKQILKDKNNRYTTAGEKQSDGAATVQISCSEEYKCSLKRPTNIGLVLYPIVGQIPTQTVEVIISFCPGNILAMNKSRHAWFSSFSMSQHEFFGRLIFILTRKICSQATSETYSPRLSSAETLQRETPRFEPHTASSAASMPLLLLLVDGVLNLQSQLCVSLISFIAGKQVANLPPVKAVRLTSEENSFLVAKFCCVCFVFILNLNGDKLS